MRYTTPTLSPVHFFLLIIAMLFSPQFTYAQDQSGLYAGVNLEKYRKANEAIGSPQEGENRVVFMGNSITEAWPVISPEFFDKHKGYIGRGISGQTTPQILLRFRADVLNLQPKVVLILAGTNDIAGNTGFTPIELIAENIMTMAELARQHDIQVIISSVLPAIDYPWKPGLEPAPKIIALNALLKAYAKNNQMIYLDYHSAMVDAEGGLKVPEYTTADDLVHPNAKGYSIMEKLALEAIKQALK